MDVVKPKPLDYAKSHELSGVRGDGIYAMTDGTAGLILNLVAAVLGVGTSTLAVANTDAKPERDPNARA